MTDIDSLIAGGVQYPSQSLSQLNDPRKIMQLMQGAQELKAGQQQMQGQMALRQLMGDPKNMGSNGELTPEAMRQMSAIDPQGAMKIREMQLKNQELTAKTSGAQTDLAKKKLDLAGDMYGAGLTAYEDGLSKGLSKEQALQQAQKVYTEKREFGKPLFSESEYNMSNPAFDPNTARAHAVNYKQYQDMQDKTRTRQEHERHDRVIEGNQAATLAETKREHDIRATTEKFGDYKQYEYKDANGDLQQVMARPEKKSGKFFDQDGKEVKDVVGTAKEMGPVPSNEQVQAIAKSIAEYRQPPYTGYASRSPEARAVMAEVNKLNPGYDAKDYKASETAVTRFTSGKQGDTVRSFNVAIDHLDTLEEATKALKNGDVKKLNQVSNAIADQFGGVAPNNFDAIKGIVGDELTKAILGSGSGALADREEMKKTIDRAKTEEQLLGAIEEYRKLMTGQLKGLKKQYEESTKRKDFDRFLADKTKDRLGVSDKKPEAQPNALPDGWSIKRVD